MPLPLPNHRWGSHKSVLFSGKRSLFCGDLGPELAEWAGDCLFHAHETALEAGWTTMAVRADLKALLSAAGLTLALTSGWALWMGLVEYQAPWCLVPQ
jgi:hypothetical protein